MQILYIISKEIKHIFRNKKSLMFMVLFPIILIIVLGSAFKTSFNNTNIGIPKVLYHIDSSGEAAKNLKSQIIDKGKDYNIKFTQVNDIEWAKNTIKNKSEYDCFILMKDDSEIELYKNGRYDYTSSLVESIMNSYIQRYNAISEIGKVKPLALSEILKDTKTEYSKVVSIEKKRTPSSIDYYSVAMLTLIIMYAYSMSLDGFSSEKQSKTEARILSAPVRRYELLSGKIIGEIVGVFLQIIIVILFSKFALNAYWGNNILCVLIVVITQIIMIISVGAGFGFIFKDSNVASSLLNILVILMVFLGGGYIPVDNIGGKVFQTITYFSPVRWTNKAIFSIIYDGNSANILPAILVNLSVAAFFIIVASLMSRKEIA